MKTERELFDDWARINIENYCDAIFDGQYYVMRENSRLTKEKKNFLILSLNMGLKSWQASLSREGYKLVPVEPSEEIIKHMTNTPIEVNLLCDNADIFLNEDEALIAYKTMIGVVE